MSNSFGGTMPKKIDAFYATNCYLEKLEAAIQEGSWEAVDEEFKALKRELINLSQSITETEEKKTEVKKHYGVIRDDCPIVSKRGMKVEIIPSSSTTPRGYYRLQQARPKPEGEEFYLERQYVILFERWEY
jgi:hypothetical protein